MLWLVDCDELTDKLTLEYVDHWGKSTGSHYYYYVVRSQVGFDKFNRTSHQL